MENFTQALPVENLYTPNSIRTVSGKYFDITKMDPETIDINDIAHALSFQPRFSGHLPVFYSVAQHSVMCAIHVTNNYKLEALMHDASEAYLVDIPSPIKALLPDYKALEDKLNKVIAEKFGITYPFSDTLKAIDRDMLIYEWEGVMLELNPVECWTPERAKKEFLDMYNQLTSNHGR